METQTTLSDKTAFHSHKLLQYHKISVLKFLIVQDMSTLKLNQSSESGVIRVPQCLASKANDVRFYYRLICSFPHFSD